MVGETEQRLSVNTTLFEIEETDKYEYKAELIDTKTGKTLDTYSSLHESYNGSGHLTEQNAKSNIEQIEQDVSNGEASSWFDYTLD